MIIWSGFGFFVALIVFGCGLAAQLITSYVTGSEAYWNTHKWTHALALFTAAVLCWFLGRFLRARGSRTLIDPSTDQSVVQRQNHSLFFIPMEFWGPILGAIALYLFLKDLFT